MTKETKITVEPGRISVDPSKGVQVHVSCPVDFSTQPQVLLDIGHGLFSGYWGLIVARGAGNFYYEKNSGELVLMPLEITDCEIVLPDHSVHLVRLDTFAADQKKKPDSAPCALKGKCLYERL